MVEQRLGKAAQSSEFWEGYEMPTYEPYTDDDGNGIGHATDADNEPMPLTFGQLSWSRGGPPKGR